MADRWRFLGATLALLLLDVRSLAGAAVPAVTEGPPPYIPANGSCNATAHEYKEADGRCCQKCPPGWFRQHLCSGTRNTVCARCPEESYTDVWHSYYTCHPCRPRCDEGKFFVEKGGCQSDSPRTCSCRDGYTCSKKYEGQCDKCSPSMAGTETSPGRVPVTSGMGTASCRIQRVLNTTSGRCQDFNQCGGTSSGDLCNEPINSQHTGSSPPVLLLLLIILFSLALLCVLLFWRRQHKVSCLKKVFRTCKQPLQPEQGSLARPAEVLLPDLPLCAPGAGGPTEISVQQEEPHDWFNSSPATANLSTEGLPPGSPEEKGHGVIGPLHIYSPGTVYVGYINNVQGGPPAPLVTPVLGATVTPPWLGVTEEGLQYPRQEESQSEDKESHAIQELSGPESWGASIPQQEINECGHWGVPVPQHEQSKPDSWGAPVPQQEQSGPESCGGPLPQQKQNGLVSLDVLAPQQEMNEFGHWGIPIPQHVPSGPESVGVLRPQQMLSGPEYFLTLRSHQTECETWGDPKSQQEKSESRKRGTPTEEG